MVPMSPATPLPPTNHVPQSPSTPLLPHDQSTAAVPPPSMVPMTPLPPTNHIPPSPSTPHDQSTAAPLIASSSSTPQPPHDQSTAATTAPPLIDLSSSTPLLPLSSPATPLIPHSPTTPLLPSTPLAQTTGLATPSTGSVSCRVGKSKGKMCSATGCNNYELTHRDRQFCRFPKEKAR